MKGSVVVVVGASSGIGLAACRRLHAQGARLVMVARDLARLERAAREVGGQAAATGVGGEVAIATVSADLATQAGRDAILASVPRCDHLLVTAADLVYRPASELDEAAVLQALRSKVVGPYLLAASIAPRIREGGSITLVSGIAAERPIPGGSITGLVNGAIGAMVRGLALELAPVRVNAVSPGWVATPFWDRIATPERRAALFAEMQAKLPTRRLTTADDVAETIELAMRNRGLSATTLYTDGGQRLV